MNNLIERLEAAGHDERLSTGALYLEAAAELDALLKALKGSYSLAEQTREYKSENTALHECKRALVEALRDLLDRVDRNGGLGEYKGGPAFVTGRARALLAKHGR